MGFSGGLISASGGLLDDFVQYILPTIIAVCLFAPFSEAWVHSGIEAEEVLVAGILIGYLLSFVLKDVSRLVFNRIPVLSARARECERVARWVSANWNYKNVFYGLSGEEQARMSLFTRHLELYRTLGFYLLLYLLANILLLIFTLAEATSSQGGELHIEVGQLLQAKTPLIFPSEPPTLLVVILTFFLVRGILNNFFSTYALVLGIDGHYAFLAAKVQQQQGGTAAAIWGQVLRSGKPCSQAAVELLDGNLRPLAKRVFTEADGRFQFKNAYQGNLGRICHIRASSGTQSSAQTVRIEEKKIPEVVIELN